ncbi:MAG: hypothetical protein PWP48_696 [Clostridiales bacterium]|nr:hypothetical protein [Clostridiales bacterium]MDK2991463.1 hypothetical protein [Clostridiales bacterium]
MLIWFDIKCKQYFGETYNPFENLNIEQAKELVSGIADTDKLWFYGYRKKAIIYTVGDVLYKTVFMIRRLVKVDSNGHREYICLYPSFALKRCPFGLNTIDQLYTENVSKGADPLDNIDDPQNILECSDSLMVWIKRVATRVENAALLENLSSSYLRITQSMPDINKSVSGCICAHMYQLMDVFKQLMEYIKCSLPPTQPWQH